MLSKKIREFILDAVNNSNTNIKNEVMDNVHQYLEKIENEMRRETDLKIKLNSLKRDYQKQLKHNIEIRVIEESRCNWMFEEVDLVLLLSDVEVSRIDEVFVDGGLWVPGKAPKEETILKGKIKLLEELDLKKLKKIDKNLTDLDLIEEERKAEEEKQGKKTKERLEWYENQRKLVIDKIRELL